MAITDNEIKRICSPTIYKRGLEYFKEGRVHLRVRKEDSLTASVDGDRLYNVHISFDEKGNISDYLCTCPYYTTMNSACKHIVSALKTRQAELLKTDVFENENDLLASEFCRSFEISEKESYRIGLCLRITPLSHKLSYFVSIRLIGKDSLYEISQTQRFLECLTSGQEYKLSKNRDFSEAKCAFKGASGEIIKILSEAYENRQWANALYSASELEIGEKTVARLIPLMTKIDCEYTIDSITYRNLPVLEENPDILVDISASGKNINISVTESGLSLSRDGEWFLFENKIFHTKEDWRRWFMPIYKGIISRNRTQLEFSGDNCIEFAAKALPRLRNEQGVVCYGIDELVVNQKPLFEIYLDSTERQITAAVKAVYGNISVMLPCASYASEKVIVRSREKEAEIVSYFSEFDLKNDLFTTEDDEVIYRFVTSALDGLLKIAVVHYSDSFNTLFITKIPKISASVSYNEKIDLLELDIDSDLSDEEISQILNAYYTHQPYYRMETGKFLDFSKDDMDFELLGLISSDNSGRIKGKRSIPKFYSLYLAALAENGRITAHREFIEMLDKRLNEKANIPPYLDNTLRDYQKTGVHWLNQLSALGLGGILADDMGLGKTLQVIAFVMSKNPEKPALVVAPSSLIYNWQDEINRFAPEARVRIIDGPRGEREQLLSENVLCDFIITSYALLRRDIEIYKKMSFSYFFIDEAQHIKNPRTMNSISVKKIKAEGYFALTGTPIENSLSELWSIFDFVLPGYLSAYKDFSAKYEKSSAKISLWMRELRSKIKPFILRRMKKDVLSELPEKIENTIFSDFEGEQKEIYTAFLKTAREEADAISERGDSAIRILSLLTRLRQICCHPRLINPEYKKDSGKLKLLAELVESACGAGHRILIFSQFTSMLVLIDEKLKHLKIDSFYLDGSTPSAERVSMANRFNKGEGQVFLISLKAGGTGLNLIGADMVIHYDPWWNPAVMDQASDRAYRIGQTKAVQVIKLAMRGSIEEQILKLAEKKRGLADEIIKENKNLLSSLSKEELLALFE